MKKYMVAVSLILLSTNIAYATDNITWQGQYFIGNTFQQGTFNFDFNVYDAPYGGNRCFNASTPITTGFWGQWLVQVSGLSAECNDSNKDYYLEITINNTTQSPRRLLTTFNYMRKNVNETTNGTIKVGTSSTVISNSGIITDSISASGSVTANQVSVGGSLLPGDLVLWNTMNDTKVPGTVLGVNLNNTIIWQNLSEYLEYIGAEFNDSAEKLYVNTTFLRIDTYSGDFPNQTVQNNLENWNNTFNSTYDAKEPAISIGYSNYFLNGSKQFTQLVSSYISDFTSTVLIIATTYGWVNNTTMDHNYNNLTNIPSDFSNTTVSNNLQNWNSTNSTAVRQSISVGSNLTYNNTSGMIDYIVPQNQYPVLIYKTSKVPNAIIMTSISQWYNATIINITSGTWSIQSSVTVASAPNTAQRVVCKLWYGSVNLSSAEETSQATGGSTRGHVNLQLLNVVSTFSNITIITSCRSTSANSLINASTGDFATNNATVMTAIKIG